MSLKDWKKCHHRWCFSKAKEFIIKSIDEETETLESGLGSGDKDKTFPVNKNRNVFFSGVNTIAAFYDSIVAATEKDSGKNGYLPVPVANEIIALTAQAANKNMDGCMIFSP